MALQRSIPRHRSTANWQSFDTRSPTDIAARPLTVLAVSRLPTPGMPLPRQHQRRTLGESAGPAAPDPTAGSPGSFDPHGTRLPDTRLPGSAWSCRLVGRGVNRTGAGEHHRSNGGARGNRRGQDDATSAAPVTGTRLAAVVLVRPRRSPAESWRRPRSRTRAAERDDTPPHDPPEPRQHPGRSGRTLDPIRDKTPEDLAQINDHRKGVHYRHESAGCPLSTTDRQTFDARSPRDHHGPLCGIF